MKNPLAFARLTMVCLLSLVFPAAQASQTMLVTESEALLYGGALNPVSSNQLEQTSEGPQILVIKPDVERPLQSPVSMQIMVVPSDGAAISWDSLKLTYGSLRFDITDRFLSHSKRTESGFAVEHLNVPAGTHRLLFSIRDSKHRLGVREFVLRIGGQPQ